MYKILAITPPSIAGEIIIKGFAKGFESLGNKVMTIDTRNLKHNDIKSFNPDYVFGYDYAHFYEKEAEEIIKNYKLAVIHYFADNPQSNFSHVGDKSLFEKLNHSTNSNNIIFCWDNTYISQFKTPKAYYLPLGINPELYQNKETEIKYGISFVGRPLGEKRQKILCNIVKNFPEKLNIFCFEKHFEQSLNDIKEKNLLTQNEILSYKKAYKGFVKSEHELSKIYAASEISLNITIQGKNNMNYRVFEVLASGGLLLTDYMQDTVEYFQNGNDAFIYENINELNDRIKIILKDKEFRNQTVQTGKAKILKYHTFEHRAKSILEKL